MQDGVYDAFTEKLSAAVAKLNVGNGLSDDVQQGPLIDMAAVEKVEQHIADAVAKGAKVAVGGTRHDLGGTFFQPTILTGVSPAMDIYREETFGPVAPIIPFDDEEEALSLANDTHYGLAAYVYTRDIGRAFRMFEGLDFGIIGVNDINPSAAAAPAKMCRQNASRARQSQRKRCMGEKYCVRFIIYAVSEEIDFFFQQL